MGTRAVTQRPVIALVADAFTRECLEAECDVVNLTPESSLAAGGARPDLLLVESAWEGLDQRWKHKIASYPRYPWRTNAALAKLVTRARERGIPTVFWSKEDGVHFERFIESARLFDHVLTVDEHCVPRYRAVVGPHVTVGTMMFAAQPATHCFTGIAPKVMRASFLGSYSRHIHTRRRELQHMVFEAAAAHLGVTVFDRNSSRRSSNYRYPAHIPLEVRPAVPHRATAQLYKDYLVSLNVNTVQDSPTMFSRRLVEILACGGLAVTTPALSVERLFAPYCHVVTSSEGAHELFARLAREGLTERDREMMRAGAEYVAQHFTWGQRVAQLLEVVGQTR